MLRCVEKMQRVAGSKGLDMMSIEDREEYHRELIGF
jgi:hypothetical protein